MAVVVVVTGEVVVTGRTLLVVKTKVVLVRVVTTAVEVRVTDEVETPEDGRPKHPVGAVHFRSKKLRTTSVTVWML